MDDVLAYLHRELPAINEFLDRQAAGLDPIVQSPVRHVLAAGGKRLRPLLTLLTARALRLPDSVDPYPLACSLELLHSATLLHDDILDEAELRRGRQSAHLVFGRSNTILAGDVLLALANRLVADYGDPRLTAILSEAIMLTVTGEVREIAAVRDVGMTHADYMDIITGKTAYLFQGACQCGALLAGVDGDLERAAHDYGLNLGIAFQLVDDALDYVNPSLVTGKPSGGDLREGKMTLPLILYLDSLEEGEREQTVRALAEDCLDDAGVARVVAGVQEGGHADGTRLAAREYADAAVMALDKFPSGPETDMLSKILEYVLTRDK